MSDPIMTTAQANAGQTYSAADEIAELRAQLASERQLREKAEGQLSALTTILTENQWRGCLCGMDAEESGCVECQGIRPQGRGYPEEGHAPECVIGSFLAARAPSESPAPSLPPPARPPDE